MSIPEGLGVNKCNDRRQCRGDALLFLIPCEYFISCGPFTINTNIYFLNVLTYLMHFTPFGRSKDIYIYIYMEENQTCRF